MNQIRRSFTPDQKAPIVHRHLSGEEPVSDLTAEFGPQPSQIHNWVMLVQILRDWYKSGKSDDLGRSKQVFCTPYLPNPVSPFHGEPLHLELRSCS